MVIPSKSDGDVLHSYDLFKIVGFHNSTNTISKNSNGTLGSVLIPANTVTSGIVVFCPFKVYHASGGVIKSQGTGTLYLLIGSPTAESEKMNKSGNVYRYEIDVSTSDNGTIIYYDDSETWTEPVSIVLTGSTNTYGGIKGGRMMVLGV